MKNFLKKTLPVFVVLIGFSIGVSFPKLSQAAMSPKVSFDEVKCFSTLTPSLGSMVLKCTLLGSCTWVDDYRPGLFDEGTECLNVIPT